MAKSTLTILCLTLLLFALSTFAAEIVGKVVTVIDGDTVEVLDADRTPQRIRMAWIDAPETGQAFGNRAKQHLLKLVGGKVVTIRWTKKDRYKRHIGTLLHDGSDMNLEMLKSGMAWWYRAYANEQGEDRGRFEQAKNLARVGRVGLWVDPDPIPPWRWRRRSSSPDDYAADCSCGSGNLCTGKQGGRFCVRQSGSKKYFQKGL